MQGPSLAELHEKFGIEGRVQFRIGKNGLTCVELIHGEAASPQGSKAEVYLHGAHVTRWAAGGFDGLWMSPDSAFAPGKPLRGGIPICWPQFGPGPLPQHGFLRNSDAWTVGTTRADRDATVVTFEHVDNEATRAVWNHPFKVVYTVRLSEGHLETALDVSNTGDSAFDFTTALHTYFSTFHISNVSVEGLAGLKYLDNLQGRKECCEESKDGVRIDKETDRIYLDAPEEMLIRDGFGNTTVVQKNAALPDAVLWNPWVNKAMAMQDYSNYGWQRMLCLETAAIKKPISLAPGATWHASQRLSLDLAPLPK